MAIDCPNRDWTLQTTSDCVETYPLDDRERPYSGRVLAADPAFDAGDQRSKANVPASVQDAIGGRFIMTFADTRPLTLSWLLATSLIANVPFIPLMQLTVPSTRPSTPCCVQVPVQVQAFSPFSVS